MRDRFSVAAFLRAYLPPVVVALGAGVAMLLAYQVRPAYAIRMNDPFDRVYLAGGFYDQETGPDSNYRWMSGDGTVWVAGAGTQPFKLVMRLVTDRQDPSQNKPVQVYARGALVAVFQVSNTPKEFEASIGPELISRATGDLKLRITTETFTPEGDHRDLGVAVTSIRLEPAGSGALLLPPLLHVLCAMAIGECLYLISLLLGLGRRGRLVVGLCGVLLLALLYAFARPYLTFYASGLLLALGLALACMWAAVWMIGRVYRRGGLAGFDECSIEARLLFAIFVVGLVVGWGGLLYPLSAPNDFGFHVHRMEEVQQGTLLFASYVVTGVGVGFYPPAMYVLFLPLSWIAGVVNVLRFVPVLLDFSMVFLVFYLGKRYMNKYRGAGLLGAALYAIMPINLLVLWWAHLTNLFGLLVLFVTVAYIVVGYERMARPAWWVGLFGLWFVVLLSHPAVLVWGILLGGAIFVALLGLKRFAGRGNYRNVLLAGAAQLAGAVVAFVLYYSHYVGIFGKQTATAPGEVSGLAQTLANFGNWAEIWARVQLTLRHGFLLDYSVWPLALAPVGLVLLFKRGRGEVKGEDLPGSEQEIDAAVGTIDEGAEQFRWAMMAWVAVGAGLLVIDQIIGIPDRPMLFLWPVVSMLAGLALAAFVDREMFTLRRIGWRSALVGLMLVGLAVMSLYFWAQANFLDQREPHIFPHVF